MSLAVLADHMASKGRGPDSMLIHMSPREVQGLQALAVKHGGSLTINPDTGLPEAGFLDKLLPSIIGAGISFFSGGTIDPMTAAAIVGGVQTVRTGDIGKGIQAGLGAYGGASLTTGLTEAGASTIGAAEAAKGLTMSPELLAEFGGDSAKDALLQQQVTDRMAAATPYEKLSSGFDAVKNNPMGMARSLATPAFMAASPILADMMVPTTTKQPGIQSNDTISQSIYDPYSGTYRRLNPVPAANYGTPAHKGFAGGGMVALNSGGIAHYETGGGVKDLSNLYAAFGGKEGYEKLQADYLKINNDPAAFATAVAQFDKPSAYTPAPAAVVTPPAKMTYEYAVANPGSVDWASDLGKQLAMDNYIGNYTKDVTTKFKTPQEQAMELMYRGSTQGGTPTAVLNNLGGYEAVKKLAESSGYGATPEWIAAYEKKMGYKPSQYTLDQVGFNPAAIEAKAAAEKAAADRAAQDKINADAAAAANKVTSIGTVDLLTDTGVKQDKTDTTSTGLNALAALKAADIKSSVTTDGTYTGTSGVAPTMNTLFGQGKFVGTGTEMGTGTTGPIMDFGGASPFGKTSPMTLAQTQLTDQAAAKTAADKAKLDLYSQWGAANPKATNLEHANFVDKIGLDPAVAARLIGISPDQALSAYNDAKFNTQTGDSKAAYDYLMGKSAYPTKSNVGQIMRPYAEATLGMPANTNRKYVYDQTTGKYSRNPDYVEEYKDPSGGVNYLMSQKEIFDYFKKNASQDDATTYAWALANNLTPKDIADATGVPLSQITPRWRAAVANKVATEVKNEDGTINKEATEKAIADKAAADKAAADIAADKAVKDSWDEAAYLAANPDVAAELASGKSVTGKPVKFTSGYEHFTSFGKAEGRKATTKKAAGGGIMKLAMGGMPIDNYAAGGGLGSLGSYSDGGRLLRGPGDGVSDSIPATIGRGQRPARLADGEFVVPARIVSELGNGSTEAGAKKLYAMMDRVQRARGKTTGKNKVAANSRADKYLPA